jgi:hypothetical protein
MTLDHAASIEAADPPPLYCYRHPDRETWVRCGRCDQPICTNCAMQGPVGMRCKTCGKPRRDALASLTPRQVLIGLTLAVGGGALVGYLALQFGFFMIIGGFFGGTFIAEACDRTIGIKRGPKILALVIGGIVVGGLIGSGYAVFGLWRDVEEFSEEIGITFADLLWDSVPQALIAIGATVVGAYSRLR